ncbi:hypothetical protein A2U01_0028280 [Trifolium medium]|uniref:Uncharacterized protein n=1 Tax=Trifolium medium TaxID=97028 RepID=A0A392P8H9_9FABA|nr:hypothetical protein [Trifolium medium]
MWGEVLKRIERAGAGWGTYRGSRGKKVHNAMTVESGLVVEGGGRREELEPRMETETKPDGVVLA